MDVFPKTLGKGPSGTKKRRKKGQPPSSKKTKLGRKPKAKSVKRSWKDRSGITYSGSIKPTPHEKGKPKKKAKSK